MSVNSFKKRFYELWFLLEFFVLFQSYIVGQKQRCVINCKEFVWCDMNLCYIILSFDFYGMIKLYLVMSCHSWSDMHLNHTFFVLWLFSSSNDLFFFFIVINTCEEQIVLWHQKCDSMERLFNYHFCLSNLILQWVIFRLLLFLLGRKRCINNPDFP